MPTTAPISTSAPTTIAQTGSPLRPCFFSSRRFGAWTGGRGVFGLSAKAQTAYGAIDRDCTGAARTRGALGQFFEALASDVCARPGLPAYFATKAATS